MALSRRSQTIPIGIVGPSATARQIAVNSARTLNLFPEIADPDAKAITSLHSTPGITPFTTVLATPTRGVYVFGNRLFAVGGTTLYEIIQVGITRNWGTLPPTVGPVGITDNAGKLIVGVGSGFYVLNLDTGVLTQVVTVNGDILRGMICLFMNQTTIYIERDSGRVFWSDLGLPGTVDDLSFITAEGAPDNITAALIVAGVLYLFGPETVEAWQFTGGTDNALAAISGGLLHTGCAAPNSVKLFAGSWVCVSRDSNGRGVVARGRGPGSNPERISSHAVEFALSQVPDLSVVTATTYSEAGHAFYMLHLVDSTWVYDQATDLWHERAWLNTVTGEFERIRQEYHAFWDNQHYFAEYNGDKLLLQSLDYHSDDGNPLVRLRRTTHSYMPGRVVTYHRLVVNVKSGVGADGAGTGTDPMAMLRYSDDGGRTWSNYLECSLGKIGEFKAQVEFWDLGSCGGALGGDRVFEFSVSDNVTVVILSAFADVTVGR